MNSLNLPVHFSSMQPSTIIDLTTQNRTQLSSRSMLLLWLENVAITSVTLRFLYYEKGISNQCKDQLEMNQHGL
jgi:hypothetical protein